MNPYEVLGIPETATDEEIKSAYKNLVKKYHPDKYHDNPLADLAEEKLQEVNEAYDLLMKTKGSSSTYNYGNANRGQTYGGRDAGPNTGFGKPEFQQARREIDAGNLQRAEEIINNSTDRSAEYFFLRGVIASRKGWYDNALSDLQMANQMDPGNIEYERYYSSLAAQGGMFRQQAQGYGYQNGADDMCCRIAECTICLNCCTPC